MRVFALRGLLALALAIGPAFTAAARDTLEQVRDRGVLRCGISTSGVGLASVTADGRWQGYFVDMCRAVAAATAGGADNIEILEVSAQNRFDAVRSGAVDVTMDGTTWTLQRDATFGVDFPMVYLYDGQGFMAHRSLGASRLSEVDEASVCVIEGTTTVHNLEKWIDRTGARMTVKRLRSTEGALSAFFNHHCDLLTNDRIGLFAQRLLNAPRVSDYVVFPDVISKEPVGPMVRDGDPRWFELVRWVFFVTLIADEKGITSENHPTFGDSTDPEVRKLLGLSPGIGAGLGLDDGWALRVIGEVGSFGEIYDRTLGEGSRLRIDRGLNDLWHRGGLFYPPPLGG
ncbi:amino acid ABC transporter substrate-binding protein [Azospirillum halopraeferens]|uniref:amino acid ABC transporter substrate-binding protein n=1 Tax=Azospirillum halopraeferens TaxID=34010 RepID=UPI0003FA2585|nr:amino acid ABC transporter substrate-binding protein [Azospirillum halopraeferens]